MDPLGVWISSIHSSISLSYEVQAGAGGAAARLEVSEDRPTVPRVGLGERRGDHGLHGVSGISSRGADQFSEGLMVERSDADGEVRC